ncbi:MAG: sigma-70 family RNA polymerase sigma factor [Planctomycetota bacterium]
MPDLDPSPPAEAAPETLADLSDEALAARVRGGCVRSYEELDRRYRVRLVHLLRRRVGREADAEDLAQATLWTAYEKIDRYDPSRKFSTWLFTIGTRKAIDLGRTRRRRGEAGGESTIASPDTQAGPLERAIRAEQSDPSGGVWKVADAVLKPEHWSALWLAYGEDQTPAEIAAALGVSRVSVRVMLHRARKRVAEALRQHAGHDHEVAPALLTPTAESA